MQAVCQFDDDYADVAAHGKEHLSQVECLLLVHAVDFDVGELGHAVDQLGHGGTEQIGHVGKRRLRVLNRVMQQRSAHHIAIHLELRQDDGDLYGMVDIQLAAAALLIGMFLRRKAVGALRLGGVLVAHIPPAERRELAPIVRGDLRGQVIRRGVMHHLFSGNQRDALDAAAHLGYRGALLMLGVSLRRSIHFSSPYRTRGVIGRLTLASISCADAESAHPRKAENSTRARMPSR